MDQRVVEVDSEERQDAEEEEGVLDVVAAHAANSTWSAGKHEQLAKSASAVFNMLSVAAPTVLEDEKAHSGLPFNELVDCLCTSFNEDATSLDWFSEATPVGEFGHRPVEAQFVWSILSRFRNCLCFISGRSIIC